MIPNLKKWLLEKVLNKFGHLKKFHYIASMALNIENLLVKEELDLLKEIILGNIKPFNWNRNNFHILPKKNIYTLFLAPIEGDISERPIPQIEIFFTKQDENIDKYEISFLVDGKDTQAFKSNISYYLKIVSTLVLIIKEFIKKYSPDSLLVKGMDKSDVKNPGQKDRIYFSFIEQEAPKLGYRVGHEKDKLNLIKNK